jgi:MFS family permease
VVPGRWRALGLLTLARASMGFQFQSAASVAPFLAHEFGLDNAQIGLLVGLYLLPGIAVALPGGILGARFGDRRVVLFGLGLMSAGGTWLAFAGDFAGAAAARLLSGTGAVLLNVLLTKMVADWFEERERVLAMSVLINAWPIGICLALFTLGPIAEARSSAVALSTAVLFAAVGLATLLAAYRDPPVVASIRAGFSLGAFSAREWWLLLLASLPWTLFNGAYAVILAFLPLYLLKQGYGIAVAGSVIGLNSLLVIGSVQAGGIWARHARNPDVVAYTGLTLYAASLCAALVLPGIFLWIAIAGLVGGLAAGLLVSLPTEILRAEIRAQGMGVFYTVYYAGTALYPPIAGWLADSSGRASAPIWFAAGSVLACVPAIALLRLQASMRAKP